MRRANKGARTGCVKTWREKATSLRIESNAIGIQVRRSRLGMSEYSSWISLNSTSVTSEGL
jgi:hypothetical protein